MSYLSGDLAILALSADADLTDPMIETINLVDSGRDYDGPIGHITGWGSTKFAGGRKNTLLDTQLDIYLQLCDQS